MSFRANFIAALMSSFYAGAIYAQSSEPSAEAKAGSAALVESGNALFKRRKFAEALDKFHAAYALHRDPRILLDIGEAHRELNQPDEAADHYERFLVEMPSELEPKLRARASERLAALQPALCFVEVTTSTSTAEMTVDGKPSGRTPLRLRLSRGIHELRLVAPSYKPVESRVYAERGKTVYVQAELEPVALAATSVPTSTRAESAALNTPSEPPIAPGLEGGEDDRWWVPPAIGVAVLGAIGVSIAIIAGSSTEPTPDPELGFSSISSWQKP